eukprot:TRINITY_DN5172_c0_g2_i1.p1 TRINITY_DN5172_c0_g2~~TRINITY_DN5172_c0_g2_i1.p1  ORF type:complete len:227 (-),score=44.72 TRINITY_DN5172_c0_g2_i1:6-686(-)
MEASQEDVAGDSDEELQLVPEGGIFEQPGGEEDCLSAAKTLTTMDDLDKASGIDKRSRNDDADIILPRVSILMPVYNAAAFLEEMLASLVAQTYKGPMELVVFDDGPSTDNSVEILQDWVADLSARNITLVIERARESGGPRGCGFGRNRAAECASGTFFCFADADDIMMPMRIELQLAMAQKKTEQVLVGSNFVRLPADATPRYTAWANNLSQVADDRNNSIYSN